MALDGPGGQKTGLGRRATGFGCINPAVMTSFEQRVKEEARVRERSEASMAQVRVSTCFDTLQHANRCRAVVRCMPCSADAPPESTGSKGSKGRTLNSPGSDWWSRNQLSITSSMMSMNS